ncbi:hypothetical protein [Pseudogemmobacter sonorensis]|uniref:hypothetical protein n=1 Tax=Pseudogemmobacter sonorensis TaxID=2989681 RepID=UPI0036AD2988
MEHISMTEAAKQFRVSKSTLSRAVKSGKMSVAVRHKDGTFGLDPSEVARFTGTLRNDKRTGAQRPVLTQETPSNAPAELVAALNARIDDLKEALTAKDAQIADIAKDRDAWRDHAKAALPAPQKTRGGLFGWLSGGKVANG